MPLALHCDKDAVVVVQPPSLCVTMSISLNSFLLHSFENTSAEGRLAGRHEDELPLQEPEVITPLSGK